MGRPVTIDGDRTVTIRLPAAQLDAIDAWADARDIPRSEAIRQLVDYALKRKRGR
jgi:metal-responsive CopG/Arc/MetJ family transcriptional regulator